MKVLDADYIFTILKKNEVKDLKKEYEIYKKRFRNEAKLFAKIHHSNVVTVLDSDSVMDDELGIEVPYFFMQFLKGENLKKVLNKNGPLSFEIIQKISSDILEALAALHSNNIIHRDIKPDNIIIEEKQNIAMLLDFGLAKDLGSSLEITDSHIALGTPYYMAPEQFKDSSKVGPATDIYSFGIVLFEMVTGRVPFKGGNSAFELMYYHLNKPIPSIRKYRPDVPEHLENVIKKALAKEPRDRYKNAKEFLADIQNSKKNKNNYKKKHWKHLLFVVIVIPTIIFLALITTYKRCFDSPEGPPPIKENSPPQKTEIQKQNEETPLSKRPTDPQNENKKVIEELTKLLKYKSIDLNKLHEINKLNPKNKFNSPEYKELINQAPLKKFKTQIKNYLDQNKFKEAVKYCDLIKEIFQPAIRRNLKQTFSKVAKLKSQKEKFHSLTRVGKVELYLDRLQSNLYVWVAKFQIESNLFIEMVYIPEAEFYLDETYNLKPEGNFFIGRTEVSNSQIKCFPPKGGSIKKDNYPYGKASIDLANSFCDKLNNYFFRDSRGGFRFTIPTKEQWLAALNGPGKIVEVGSNIEEKNINYDSKSKTPREVNDGNKNDYYYGLYHMYGNVAELSKEGFLLGGSYISRNIEVPLEDPPKSQYSNNKTDKTDKTTIGIRLCLIPDKHNR